ncbi:hypothetical protein H072_4112 [Dactylellina haptotyla CBS 200.50]|uniref:Major facilitator superfamily (MFS) profile domain-containing protein n=1 Tax=Dactylellina haptotyla (strain CBS 200.50) TaxID=1284197 RepID=S8AGE2_DACHA|nr:hypothetical protein H072_4112 [Dactylellina haptotyla CBS 200.50]
MVKERLFVRFLRKIVKNDSMVTDPTEVYNWRVYLLACASCFGGMLFGMDIGVIGGVLQMDSFKSAFGTDKLNKSDLANTNANIVSCLQGGCFFGSLIAPWFADKFGRKPALLIFSAEYQSNGIIVFDDRFVAGLGVGAATMINPLYVSENAPRAIRGLLTGLYQLFETAGIMLAFWINYGSLLHVGGHGAWQLSLAMQCMPAVLLFFGMLLCDESPRFLATKDRWEDATAILTKVRMLPESDPYIQAELAEIHAQLEFEAGIIAGASYWARVKEMFSEKSKAQFIVGISRLIPLLTPLGNRKRALLSIALMVWQQLTGTNAINFYAPQIFNNLGITGTKNGLFATGIYGIVKMVSCFCFLLVAVDSLGRRRSLIWTSIGMGMCMFYIGGYICADPPQPGQPVPGAGYFALVCIFIFAALFQFGWGPVCWIYVSEIPTTRLRGINVSFAAATQWLFNFAVSRATPVMLVHVGRSGFGTYFIFGSFNFAMCVFVWFLIPETKGISLERMDELFGAEKLPSEGIDLTTAAKDRRAFTEKQELADVEHLENV